MKNYVQEGENLELTAPVGGVVSGLPYKIGVLLVIAAVTKVAGEKFAGATEGVFKLKKASALVLAEGALVQWKISTGEIVASAGDFDLGYVTEAAGAGLVSVNVKLKAV